MRSELTEADLTPLEAEGLREGFTTMEAIVADRARAARYAVDAARTRAAAARIREQLANEKLIVTTVDAARRVLASAGESTSAADEADVAPAAAAPAVAPVPPAAAAPIDVEATVRGRATKFEDRDVTPPLRQAAVAWVSAYTGDFAWLIQQRAQIEAGRSLSTGAVRGVLNSWRAELRRRPVSTASASVPTAPVGPTSTEAPRVNRHAGRCIRCRAEVEAGAGTLRRAERGWVVLCAAHSDPSASAAAPMPATAKAALPDVPAGRYAVQLEGEPLRFYRVDRPTDGAWAGATFVALQASDDLYPVRDRRTKAEVLEAIAVDPHAAALRYGHELGRCYACGRTLTDATSRDLGIGPECRAKAAA